MANTKLQRRFERTLDEARRASHAGALRGERLHEVRVSIKRLRAYLKLARAPSRSRAPLANAAHALAPLRDREILARASRRWHVRVETRGAKVRAARAPDSRVLRARLERLLRSAAFPDRAARTRAGLKRLARRGRGALKACRAPAATDSDFHRLRRRLKDWIYALDATGAGKQRLAPLKKAAEALGNAHDLALLESFAPLPPAARAAKRRAYARALALLGKRSFRAAG
jgi:CHAD domain-containing protein